MGRTTASVLDTGETVTAELVRAGRRRGAGRHRQELGRACATTPGSELFEQVALAEDFADFLTLPAYETRGLTE